MPRERLDPCPRVERIVPRRREHSERCTRCAPPPPYDVSQGVVATTARTCVADVHDDALAPQEAPLTPLTQLQTSNGDVA